MPSVSAKIGKNKFLYLGLGDNTIFIQQDD